MRPIQLFRAWTKKERKTTDSSNDLSKRSGPSTLRSRSIRHIPHDIDDWLVSPSIDGASCRHDNSSLTVSDLKRPTARPYSHAQSSSRSPSLSINNLPSDYIPPRRPPRPPSLYGPIPSQSEYALSCSLPEDSVFSQSVSDLPNLDSVWERFLKDTNEDPNSLLMEVAPRKAKNSGWSRRTRLKPRVQDDRDICVVESPGYSQYSRSYAIASSPCVPCCDQAGEKCILSDDYITSHSFLDAPLHTKKVPIPLVLFATGSSSYDSTPVATPTTPSPPACCREGNRSMVPHHKHSNSSLIACFPLVPELISQPQLALAHSSDSDSLPSLVRTSSSSTLSTSSNYESSCNSDFDDSKCPQVKRFSAFVHLVNHRNRWITKMILSVWDMLFD